MISALCDDLEVSRSTGFVWLHGEDPYLVTNWHCLTGVNPYSGKSLSKTGARPNKIDVSFATQEIGVRFSWPIELYNDSGMAKWLVHPSAGEQVDVAAIKICKHDFRSKIVPHSFARAINSLPEKNLELFVGDELLIAGFPRNLSNHRLPLFKRATFASEPILFADVPEIVGVSNRRQVWVDTSTREGMSGAPVLHVKRSIMLRGKDNREYDDLLDAYAFYGIYSGRLNDIEGNLTSDSFFASQIGIVWPKPLIERIVDGQKRDHFQRFDAFAKTIEVS